jgi:hypothetical protein
MKQQIITEKNAMIKTITDFSEIKPSTAMAAASSSFKFSPILFSDPFKFEELRFDV